MNRTPVFKAQLTNTIIEIDDKSRKVIACFSAFGNKDYDGDVLVKGAYSKTLKEQFSAKNAVWILKNHNEADNLTKPFEAYESEQGLIMGFECPNTTLGNDTFELYKSGIYDQHSVKIGIIKSTEQSDANYITEAMLFEGSFVLWGANEKTPTLSVGKNADAQYLEKVRVAKKNWNGSYKAYQELEFIETTMEKSIKDIEEIQKKSGVPLPSDEGKIIVTDKNIKDAEVIKKGMYSRIQKYKDATGTTELTALQETEYQFLENAECYLQCLIRSSAIGLISPNTKQLATSIIQFAMTNIDAVHSLEQSLFPNSEDDSASGEMGMGMGMGMSEKNKNTEPSNVTQPLYNKSILSQVETILQLK